MSTLYPYSVDEDLNLLTEKTPEELDSISPEAYRLAFADPEFISRREVRGIRMQLELLKPDLEQKKFEINNTIVVYGSARFIDEATALKNQQDAKTDEEKQKAQQDLNNASRYEMARSFANLIAKYSLKQAKEYRLYICTGGGPGIMEAANRGAFEAGALNLGLNIILPHEQKGNDYITPELCFKFNYFALRKMHFMMRASALVAFPGGFGTLDELFEVLTLIQTTKAKPVPIVLFDSKFWKRLINFDLLIEEGMINANDLKLFKFADTPAQAWQIIKDFYKLTD